MNVQHKRTGKVINVPVGHGYTLIEQGAYIEFDIRHQDLPIDKPKKKKAKKKKDKE